MKKTLNNYHHSRVYAENVPDKRLAVTRIKKGKRLTTTTITDEKNTNSTMSLALSSPS
jgi:hypothetical protein